GFSGGGVSDGRGVWNLVQGSGCPRWMDGSVGDGWEMDESMIDFRHVGFFLSYDNEGERVGASGEDKGALGWVGSMDAVARAST
ncbi:hypothetical protein Tco_1288918, partial [Tanacetum coccineum]